MTFIREYSNLPKNVQSQLHDLGLKYKCDKSTVKCFCCPVKKQCDQKYSYLYHYEQFMKLKRDNINLLEIGVRDGASFKIWDEYFSNSKLIGIDIDPKCNRLKGYSSINILIGDCNNGRTVQKVRDLDLLFDYIIDDGSHKFNDITNALQFYYPLLNSGGIYIIEDLATMERISKKSLKDLKHHIERCGDYQIYESPETLIIQKL